MYVVYSLNFWMKDTAVPALCFVMSLGTENTVMECLYFPYAFPMQIAILWVLPGLDMV